MIVTCTYKTIYNTLKNGKQGRRVMGYELVNEERCYSPEELDEFGNVKLITEVERRAETEKFIWAISGLSLDDYARKILKAFHDEQEAEKKEVHIERLNNIRSAAPGYP